MKTNTILLIIFIVATIAAATFYIQKLESIKIATPKISSVESVKQQLILDVKNQNPTIAISDLSSSMKKNPAILQDCHALAHQIGDSAYQKYGDVAKALSYKDEICGGGYFHGVIETYLNSVPNIQVALKTICNTYTDPVDIGNCYHGVGHGLMLASDNNVPLSLLQCNAFSEMKNKVHCSEGVFMENFNTDSQDHPSEYLNQKDPFSVCRVQTISYQKATCYFYAPLFYLNLHPGQYQNAFNWCMSSENNFIDSCIKGVASRATKEHINNIPFTEKLCNNITPAYQNACAEGIGSYYTTQYGDPSHTKAMCLALDKKFQISCIKSGY